DRVVAVCDGNTITVLDAAQSGAGRDRRAREVASVRRALQAEPLAARFRQRRPRRLLQARPLRARRLPRLGYAVRLPQLRIDSRRRACPTHRRPRVALQALRERADTRGARSLLVRGGRGPRTAYRTVEGSEGDAAMGVATHERD